MAGVSNNLGSDLNTIGSLAPYVYQMDDALRSMGYNVPSLIKSADLKTIGLIGTGFVFGVILLEIISYLLGVTKSIFGGGVNQSIPYGNGYGRDLVVSAAKVWEKRDELLPPGRGGRSSDAVTNVLDSISNAVLKYEKASKNEKPSSHPKDTKKVKFQS